MDDCLREPQPLQHAFRVLPDSHMAPLIQSHQFEQLRYAPGPRRRVHTGKSGVEVEHASASEISGKAVIFGQVADVIASGGFSSSWPKKDAVPEVDAPPTTTFLRMLFYLLRSDRASRRWCRGER